MTITENEQISREHQPNVINLVFHPEKEKPWVLNYHDVSVWQTARAAVNYPVTEFKTREEAEQVGEMIRDIIHADAVEVELPDGEIVDVLDDTEPAKFFEVIHRNNGEETSEDRSWDAVNNLSEDEIRENQLNSGIELDRDRPVTPGLSQTETEAAFDRRKEG